MKPARSESETLVKAALVGSMKAQGFTTREDDDRNRSMLSREAIAKVLIALVASMGGGVFSYTYKAITIESRLASMEHSLDRIERRLFPVPPEPEKDTHGHP